MTKSLLTRTQAFWKLSSAWNNPNTVATISTSEALAGLNEVTDITFYKRPLLQRAKKLRDEIVQGNRRKRKKPSSDNTVTPMRARSQQ